MTASLRVGALVRVARPARYNGTTHTYPAVGDQGKIVRFTKTQTPVIEITRDGQWLVDADCLELVDEEVPQEEVQQAIDSILKTNHNVIPSPKEDT